MIVNREAFYVCDENLYYVSFNAKSEVNSFSLYSEGPNYSYAKEYMAKKSIMEKKYNKILEMVYMYRESAGFEFICIENGRLKYVGSKEAENTILLYKTKDRYYDELYQDRISKYFGEEYQLPASEFWKIMAQNENKYSVEEALDYIDSHSSEFYVEKLL